MTSRKRFVKSIMELNSLIKKEDSIILCHHSPLDEYGSIEVTISSFNEKDNDDMWDIDMMWSEESMTVYSTLALICDGRVVQWFTFEDNMSEILAHPRIERVIKEWIIFNLDLFI